jgi:hypothetical protein
MATKGSLDVCERWDRLGVGGLISMGTPVLVSAILSVVVLFGQGREMPQPATSHRDPS